MERIAMLCLEVLNMLRAFSLLLVQGLQQIAHLFVAFSRLFSLSAKDLRNLEVMQRVFVIPLSLILNIRKLAKEVELLSFHSDS